MPFGKETNWTYSYQGLHREGSMPFGLDWIEQCFTSPPTQYRLYGRRFLQVKRPNQQYQSMALRSTVAFMVMSPLMVLHTDTEWPDLALDGRKSDDGVREVSIMHRATARSRSCRYTRLRLCCRRRFRLVFHSHNTARLLRLQMSIPRLYDTQSRHWLKASSHMNQLKGRVTY